MAATTLALVIPVRNAGALAARQVSALQAQRRRADRIVVIDSASSDGSPEIYRAAGCELHRIDAAEFDHGATRNLGARLSDPADLVVYLTQDALPADAGSLEALLRPFEDPEVAIVCGRQLPRPEAGPIERHARLFNYPATSATRGKEAAARIGLKAVFNSNSFAAYRRAALQPLGWFPERVIMGEDQVAAGRALLAGWKIAYAGDAAVVHSHGYTVAEEFRRYFDIGVFHGQQRFLLEAFGGADSEGRRYVLSELRYLARRAPHRVPEAVLRTAAKLLAYRLGRREAALPPRWKRRLSMHARFFERRPEAAGGG